MFSASSYNSKKKKSNLPRMRPSNIPPWHLQMICWPRITAAKLPAAELEEQRICGRDQDPSSVASARSIGSAFYRSRVTLEDEGILRRGLSHFSVNPSKGRNHSTWNFGTFVETEGKTRPCMISPTWMCVTLRSKRHGPSTKNFQDFPLPNTK